MKAVCEECGYESRERGYEPELTMMDVERDGGKVVDFETMYCPECNSLLVTK